jgi:hypothetical protein
MYIYIVIPIIVSFIIPIISTQIIKNAKIKNIKSNNKPFVMQASKPFSYTLLFMTLFFSFCTVLFSIYEDVGLGFETVMIVFICIMSYFCIQSFREKIVIYTDFLCYTPTIGKTRKIFFKDVIDVKIKKYSNGLIKYHVYSTNGQFVFSNYAKGFNILLNKLKKHINYNI